MTLLGSRSHNNNNDEEGDFLQVDDDFGTAQAPPTSRPTRAASTSAAGHRRRPVIPGSATVVRRTLAGDTDSRVLPTEELPLDRLGILWSAKWWILGVSAVVVVATLSVTALFVPATFAASTDVRFTTSASANGQAQDAVSAANDFAAQYAQIVKSDAVIAAAASQLGMSSSDLQERTSAGTVASQNLVRVTVQADSSSSAQDRATAVGNSLVAAVNAQSTAAQAAFTKSLATQLAPLDQQIASAKSQVDAAGQALAQATQSDSAAAVSGAAAALTAAQSQLTSLTDRRNILSSQATLQAGSSLPLVALVGATEAPSKVQPQPLVYAAVALIVALVVGGQVAITLASRRRQFPIRTRTLPAA